MSASDQGVIVAVPELAMVGEARRAAQALAERLGLDADAVGRVALVATEVATNVARHGRGGWLLLRAVGDARMGVEVVGVDHGPGMADIERCRRDGVSSAGTAGEGLGTITRNACEFDIWSQPGRGTVVVARIADALPDDGSPAATDRLERVPTGAVNLPLSEPPSGDAFAVRPLADGVRLLVVDGLGHGPLAADAAREALRVFADSDGRDEVETLRLMHGALMKTRGAAASLCRISPTLGTVRFTGIGNVAGTIVGAGRRQGMLCHNGILGHQFGRALANDYAAEPGAVIVLHSDGITPHWDLAAYPGLALRHPALIAAIIWRDHRRGRDDATVLAARRV